MSKCEHLNWSYDAYQKHWVCEDCHHRANEPYTTLARYASTITEDLSRGRTVSFTGPPDPSERRTPADRDALADALIAWAADVGNAYACDSYTVPFCVFCNSVKMEHAPDCLHLRARALRGNDG